MINHEKNYFVHTYPILVLLLGLVLGMILGGIGMYFYQKAQPELAVDTTVQNQPAVSTIKEEVSNGSMSDTVVDDAVYLGKSSQYRDYFMNLATGEYEEHLPFGYRFSDGGSLYAKQKVDTIIISTEEAGKVYYSSYNLETKQRQSIFDEPLGEHDRLLVHQSISDQTTFYFEVITYEANPPEDAAYGPAIIGKRSYFYDAITNELTESDVYKKLEVCKMYDSVYERFFQHPCGEGIGNAGPVSMLDVEGNLIKEVISYDDFTEETKYMSVEVRNGHIFARGAGDSELVWLDPSTEEPTLIRFTTTQEDVKEVLGSQSAYSMYLAKDQKTIIMGASGALYFFRYNNQNEIVAVDAVKEDRPFYPNFLYLHNGVVYYESWLYIKAVDIETAKIVKEYPHLSDETSNIYQFGL